MEKRSYNPQKIKLDLKHVPPLDPSIITPSSKVKYEKHRPNSGVFAPRVVKAWPKEGAKVAEFDDASKLRQNLKVGGASFCSTKCIDPNSTKNNIHGKNIESSTGNEKRLSESKSEDAPVKVSAKSQLHEVCAAKNWKPPLFECFKEEGPDHFKLNPVVTALTAGLLLFAKLIALGCVNAVRFPRLCLI
ncbi:ribonuclease 3-like protein 1 isoform X3 [Mangifera indica]|uniref:ribonuclease 3-like protein 1 isoform X3 n=1 Tax=Mangifera indica TaxID=29780 RepID=UPI001CFBEF8E|nr:ribonuclease 3-like protein 1 isoform X3 [Mangifera indica]XP_044494880.1 ribonuclease 3-like protein 1 isoform X3 [Mangifera indica]